MNVKNLLGENCLRSLFLSRVICCGQVIGACFDFKHEEAKIDVMFPLKIIQNIQIQATRKLYKVNGTLFKAAQSRSATPN